MAIVDTDPERGRGSGHCMISRIVRGVSDQSRSRVSAGAKAPVIPLPRIACLIRWA
ncbi:hypothetical protein B0G69_7060 [Paraburkholderia sp. RAU2J]|nr:hypothetical protein B0G69_7060 [Paraburkholderia sp. RAU2J]